MNPRITALLLLIVLALGAFIYFYEVRGKETREQVKKEEQKFFAGVTKEGISQIRLTTNDGVDVTLDRVDGRWQIVSPHTAPADEITVESMLSALVSAAKESALQDVQGLEIYGLDASAKIIRFTAHGVEHFVRIGHETKLGGTKYVMVDSAHDVTTLPTYVLATFDHSFDELRDKRVLYFDQAAVDQIRVRRSSERDGILLEKQDGAWQIRSPIQAVADADTVETLLSDLYFVRAQEFVDAPTSEQRRALAEPALQVELRTRNEVGEEKNFAIAFSASSDEEMRLISSDTNAFYRVASDVFDSIPQEIAAYRNKRLGHFDPEAVKAFSITFYAANREPVVIRGALAAGKAEQLIRAEDEADTEGDTNKFRDWLTTPDAMDPSRVEDLLLELSHLRASSIVVDRAEQESLIAFGLNPAQIEVEVFGSDQPDAKASLAHFFFGEADAEQGIAVKLSTSSMVYRVPYGLARVLPLSLEVLRSEFTVGAEEGELEFSEPEE